MAFYALYKWFSRFRKAPYTNMIRMYKNYLYSEWYNSLTEEERQKEDERVLAYREKRDREFKMTMAKFHMLNRVIRSKTGSSYSFFDMI